MKNLIIVLIPAALAAPLATSCGKEEVPVAPRLSVSDSLVTLAADANSQDTLVITSNTGWAIASSESWLSVAPSTGANTDTVVLTAQEHTDPSAARTATLTVTAQGLTPTTLQVTQQAAAHRLGVSRVSVGLSAEAGSADTFRILSNASWTVANPADWLTVTPETGQGDGIVTVTAASPRTLSTGRAINLSVAAAARPSLSVRVLQAGIPCSPGDEAPCAASGCALPNVPTYASLASNAFLPNPFAFLDGTPVSTRADWACRRAEIALLAQEFQYGYKPCTPYSATTASLQGNTLTVNVEQNGKAISFSCMIQYPTSGAGPFPAMIAMGFSSLNNQILNDLGVAIIYFPNSELAQQQNAGSRGLGKFYELFCANHSAGALMAWAWGVSRLIDALEKTPEANIDPTRLGVTGCSRNGKGALCAGAFDERIVLTIPQESGSGGAASWRVSDHMMRRGQSTQTLSQIVGENCWFRHNLRQFSTTATRLPLDQHLVKGLCAPRALLVVENDILWLGPESSWSSANAAHTIWTALGAPDAMGYAGANAHGHCSYPGPLDAALRAYVSRFLVGGGTDDTRVMLSEPNHRFDRDLWINWTVPNLQ